MKLHSNIIFNYKGFWDCDAHCRLDIAEHEDRTVVIATELDSNDGTSITNMAEQVATLVCQAYHIPHDRLVWIEHYPALQQVRPETWSRVTFTWDGLQFKHPQWKYLPPEKAATIFGGSLPTFADAIQESPADFADGFTETTTIVRRRPDPLH